MSVGGSMRIVSSEVPLYDKFEKKMVPAVLLEDIEQERIEETGLVWKHRRQQLGQWSDIEHKHWDWGWKANAARNYPGFQTFAIEHHGQMQGLMLVYTKPYATKLFPDKGKPILYVSYLESAPDNVYGQHLKHVGVELYRTAIQYSINTGNEGRVGLHSLPQAEGFYENACDMVHLGKDYSEEGWGLVYFESTRILSREFLKRKNKGDDYV